MVKTIEERPPEQVRGRPSPSSGPATPRALPALPAASLSGPFRLPAVLPEGRPPTGPQVADIECFVTNPGHPFESFFGILPHSRETTSRGIGKPASDIGCAIHLF
jgi:hypothetical protein